MLLQHTPPRLTKCDREVSSLYQFHWMKKQPLIEFLSRGLQPSQHPYLQSGYIYYLLITLVWNTDSVWLFLLHASPSDLAFVHNILTAAILCLVAVVRYGSFPIAFLYWLLFSSILAVYLLQVVGFQRKLYWFCIFQSKKFPLFSDFGSEETRCLPLS